MKNFTIRLAGQYFTICPVCDYITEYCKDYIVADVKRGAATETGGTVSESTPENSVACATESPVYFSIVTTQSDIDFEREKSAREDIKEGIPIRHFSDAYLETLAVYRKDCRPPLISRYLAFSWLGHCGRWRRLSFYRKKRYRQVHTYTTVERIFRGACRHGKRR